MLDKQLPPKSLDPPVPKKPLPPPEKRERNQFGDYVVTKIEIKELKPVVKEEEVRSEDSDESDEPEEPEVVEEQKEVKKEPIKLLSKKEKQKLEDEEFERVMNEMGVKEKQQDKVA